MREVQFRHEADAQYKVLCEAHPRLRVAIDGALLTIGIAGDKLPLVPGSSDLRAVATVKGHLAPEVLVFFTDDLTIYWVERIRLKN